MRNVWSCAPSALCAFGIVHATIQGNCWCSKCDSRPDFPRVATTERPHGFHLIAGVLFFPFIPSFCVIVFAMFGYRQFFPCIFQCLLGRFCACVIRPVGCKAIRPLFWSCFPNGKSKRKTRKKNFSFPTSTIEPMHPRSCFEGVTHGTVSVWSENFSLLNHSSSFTWSL